MANYTNHKNNKPLTKDILEEIDRRIKNGETKTGIAKALGISHSVVRKYTAPLPFRIEVAVKEDVIRRLSLGESRRSIATALGVSRQWVSQLAPEKGKRMVPITEQQKDELMELVLSGKTTSEAARELGMLQETAYAIVKARTEMPDEKTVEKIKNQINAGKSLREAAVAFNLPISILKRFCKKNPNGQEYVRYTDQQKLEMAKMHSQGIMLKSIMIKFGCSALMVKKSYQKALSDGLVDPRIDLSLEDDRNLKRIERLYPQFEAWRQYALEWYKIVKGNFTIHATVINRFFVYLFENTLFEHPVDFLLRKNAKLIPSFYENYCPHSDHGSAMNNALVDFIDWILVQPEFADTSEDDYPVTLPMFKNPFARTTRSDHSTKRGSESNKKVMPYWMIYDLRRRIAEGPNFSDWKWLQSIGGKETVSGLRESRDWFEVSTGQIDVNDPDCVVRHRPRIGRSPIIEMWSPVRWVACLLKLQTTARTGQIRMLDSGEADTFVYQNGDFVQNETCLKQGTIRKQRRQGVIRKSADGSICLFFNTNKTQDIRKLGAEKGMECPWPKFPDFEDDPYYWLEKLRNWQTKYNPISALVAWKDIPSARRLRGKSETSCSTYPDAAFLFRTAEVADAKEYPPGNGLIDKAWQTLIADYETILELENKRNPDGSSIRLVNNGRSEFPPHSLRVSLITHLILDGDMPPELMMKIVGHARFVMTIYYTKPGSQRIEDALQNAAKALDEKKDETLIRDLKSISSDKIRQHIIFNSSDLIDVIPLNPAERNPAGWLPLHDGICLAGGNTGPVNGDVRVPGCHNGGPLLDDSIKAYGPSPGGLRNCCRCRWKCAGKHHILGLQATFNNRQYHLYNASAKAIEAEQKRNELLQKKALTENASLPFEGMAELRAAERIYEVAMQKMENLALDLAAVYRMIERLKALPESTKAKVSFAAQGDSITLQTMLEETDSELLVLSGICEDVEFFPDLDPGTAIFEYAALLDRAFEREGKPLIFARMSEKEKLIAANSLMRELDRLANPDNSILARRRVVEVLERGESLEEVLGIKFNQILNVTNGLRYSETSVNLIQDKKGKQR